MSPRPAKDAAVKDPVSKQTDKQNPNRQKAISSDCPLVDQQILWQAEGRSSQMLTHHQTLTGNFLECVAYWYSIFWGGGRMEVGELSDLAKSIEI